MPAGRLCGTRIETLAMMHRGISLPATALRSPNSGVKLPLLASPLFPMETTPSALRLLSSLKLNQDRRHRSLWSIFSPCCSEHPSRNQEPLDFQQLQSTNLLRTFLNVVPQSDNYGRPALKELSFLLPIFG